MDDIVAVTLFRHGLTEENKRKAYLGWNDSPLCQEEAEALSFYSFPSQSYDLFVSSDLNRSLSTLELLFGETAPIVLSELREMNFGIFEGKTYAELKNVNEYEQWLRNYFTYAPPQGESFQQFAERVDQGWEKVKEFVLQQGYQRPFIMTHGGVIRYLLNKYSNEEKEFWDWEVPHSAGWILKFTKEGLRRGERCISLQAVTLTENGIG